MSSEYVITSGAATFEADVIAASHERPVLVDFWAEWCGPCKSVAPILDGLADEFAGALVIAKVDTDSEQDLAQSYGIRSLPTMLLFRNGKPVEQIIGAQPGETIRQAIEPFLPRPGDGLIENAAALLDAGDLEAAGVSLRAALAEDPNNYLIHPLLAQVLIRQGDYAGAEQLVATLPINIVTDAAFEQVNAQLSLAAQVAAGVDRQTLEQQTADPENVEARFHLSVLQALDSDFDSAINPLLDLIVTHRDWNNGAIHKIILDIFRAMGNADPRIKEFRTRLARTLN